MTTLRAQELEALKNKLKKIDHLLLLVGSNPLPNLVAAELLAAPGAAITLVTTKAMASVGERLHACLNAKNQGWRIDSADVPESDPVGIAEAVRSRLQRVSDAPVGLNYTGGTKAMSVHAYRAVERWAEETNQPKPHMSYLNARDLQLVVEKGPHPAIAGRSHDVGLAVKPSLETLIELHGWKLTTGTESQAIEQPAREVVGALLQIHAQRKLQKAWDDWLYNVLDVQVRQSGWAVERQALRQAVALLEKIRESRMAAPLPDDMDETLEAIRYGVPKGKRFDSPLGELKPLEQLQQIQVPWPAASGLQPYIKQMKETLSQPDVLCLKQAATNCGLNDAGELCKWLNGLWLETAVLGALQDNESELDLHDIHSNLKPRLVDEADGETTGEHKKEDFEFDVSALRGYQLFACSCTTESVKGPAKLKLFEAYIRARQLGGDEARIGLICAVDNHEKLQRDIHRDIDPGGRVTVFGAKDLPHLGTRLKNWIIEQSNSRRA